jgi:Tripartite ATP-independent periplasmic transporters, DctQ component
MRNQKLPFILFATGVATVIFAICWSLYALGEVGQLVGPKGLRPNNSFHCLAGFWGNCELLGPAHAEKGTLAYSPWAFWIGIAAIIASFWLNLRKRDDAETWPERLQHLLIPVDRVSAFVGQTFAWSILLLTFAVTYEVFSRYVLGRPTDWAFDASYILYGMLFIMSGAYAMSRNAHVRGDFLYRSWSERNQARMDLLLYFLFFFPGIIASSMPAMALPRSHG